jgi:hypothetical protein
MDRDDRALEGLLLELGRAPQSGADEAFVARILARAERKTAWKPRLLIAAAALVAALGFLVEPPATARIGFARQACLVPEARTMRLIAADGDRRLLLGEVPITAQARVPAATPILLQAVDVDGYAVWTAPQAIRLNPREVRSPAEGPVVPVDLKTARSVDYAREVKPLLDQHCAGCHAEAEIVNASTVKPFDARRSGLVTQSHAPIPAADRRHLALWVDLGAAGRP